MTKIMENNIMNNNFYKQLTESEKQECDLCRDWSLRDCARCNFFSRFSHKNKQEVYNMVVLYTIDCPQCLVLEKKLKAKNIVFLTVSDTETIVAKGFGDSSFPILVVDGVVMDYKTAISWINNQ